jgi:hypothetical protein
LRDQLRREAGLEVVERENERFGIVTGELPSAEASHS